VNVRRSGITVLGIVLATAARALPCDQVCVADDRYESMLGRYKHVLVGRVEEQIDKVGGPEFQIKVIRVWKGNKKTITLKNTSGMCGLTPAVGRVYVIFAQDDPQDVDICSPVLVSSDSRAKEAIARLDKARRLPPLSLPQADLRYP
jgi:hypothetical protein